MWRSKKFIVVAVLATVVLVGGIGGVVLAQTGNGDEDGSQPKTLLARVCEIYEQNTGVAIDSQELEDAFIQARSEMRDEALNNYLKNLVDQGKITQEQADQYKAWWQARPDIPAGFGFMAPGGEKSFAGFCGRGGGFRGWFEPPPPE